jgi:hypothetical protein
MSRAAFEPRFISMRCLAAESGASYPWHSHPFEELTLVTEDSTLIGYGAGERPTDPNTLFFVHRGERHGGWNTPQQTPRYWVIHFSLSVPSYRMLDRLAETAPEERVWALSRDQVETFKSLFLHVLNEQIQQRSHCVLAESAWLQLLLLFIQRWATGEMTATLTREVDNPDLRRLWHLVNACAEDPSAALQQIHDMPNYDSVRHGFRKAFGCSPREMILRLRMQFAKNLLLESGLSIKEIAARAGYARQHEFARTFHKHVGVAPSQWRRNPFLVPGGSDSTI